MAFTEKTPEFGPNTALLPGLNNMLDDDDNWKVDKNAGTHNLSNLGVLTFGAGGYAASLGVGRANPWVPTVISTLSGPPSLNCHDANGHLALNCEGGQELVFGFYPTSPYAAWVQTRHDWSAGLYYPMALNPLGGNVGIGTASPVTALAVASATTPTITIQDTDVNGSGEYWYIQNSSGTLNLGQTTSGDGSYAGWTDRLTILNTGKVGIGTASPTAKLQVVGLASYANNGAAAAAGLTAGALYIVTGTNPAQVAIVT